MNLRDKAKRAGVTAQDIMAEFNLGESTVHSILSERYIGKKEVADAVALFIDERLEKRPKTAAPDWRTLDQRAMEAVLGYAYDDAELSVLAGPPGIGKTFAVARFAAARPGVLHYKCIEGLSWGDTLEELCELVGIPVSGTCSDKMRRIMKALRKGDHKLLVIDEVEHLIALSSRSHNFLRRVAFFREVNDYARIGVVLVGLELLESELRHAPKTYISSRVLNLMRAKTPTDKDLREYWCDVLGMPWDATAKALVDRTRSLAPFRTLESVAKKAKKGGGNVAAAIHFVYA